MHSQKKNYSNTLTTVTHLLYILVVSIQLLYCMDWYLEIVTLHKNPPAVLLSAGQKRFIEGNAKIIKYLNLLETLKQNQLVGFIIYHYAIKISQILENLFCSKLVRYNIYIIILIILGDEGLHQLVYKASLFYSLNLFFYKIILFNLILWTFLFSVRNYLKYLQIFKYTYTGYNWINYGAGYMANCWHPALNKLFTMPKQ